MHLNASAGYTFKEVDTRYGRPKGTAFRAFKRLGRRLREGRDFHLLAAGADAELIAELRAAGRVYSFTVNAVVLTESGYRLVRERFEGEASEPG